MNWTVPMVASSGRWRRRLGRRRTASRSRVQVQRGRGQRRADEHDDGEHRPARGGRAARAWHGVALAASPSDGSSRPCELDASFGSARRLGVGLGLGEQRGRGDQARAPAGRLALQAASAGSAGPPRASAVGLGAGVRRRRVRARTGSSSRRIRAVHRSPATTGSCPRRASSSSIANVGVGLGDQPSGRGPRSPPSARAARVGSVSRSADQVAIGAGAGSLALRASGGVDSDGATRGAAVASAASPGRRGRPERPRGGGVSMARVPSGQRSVTGEERVRYDIAARAFDRRRTSPGRLRRTWRVAAAASSAIAD